MTARRQAAPGKKQSRIPEFSTVEDAAKFWDEHDSDEFEDEFEDVTDVKFVPAKETKPVIVQLEIDTFATLAEEAKAKGVKVSTLARQWILERLHRETMRS